jgi:hypothetical protein
MATVVLLDGVVGAEYRVIQVKTEPMVLLVTLAGLDSAGVRVSLAGLGSAVCQATLASALNLRGGEESLC